MPSKESLLSRGMDPPKPPKNASVLTCAHVTLPCSVLRVRDVRTGNGRCIVFRHFLSLDWVSPQRLIPTMRSWSFSAPVMSPPASFWKFASMKMGKAGQISSAVFMSVLDLHTSCKLRWPACPKTSFLHLLHMFTNSCHGHVLSFSSFSRRYESNIHRRTSSETLSMVNLSKLYLSTAVADAILQYTYLELDLYLNSLKPCQCGDAQTFVQQICMRSDQSLEATGLTSFRGRTGQGPWVRLARNP